MLTEKQLAANRRNAQKSTGPRTEQGRARSRFNAVKHGLCAEHYDIPDDPSGPYSVQDLLDHWNDFYQPASPVEALLIRQIVTLQWRLDRAPRHETGLLAKTVDECFHAHWIKNKETGEETNPLCYDSEEDLPGTRRNSTRLLGMAWREMCRDSNPLPKLQRYETALANRLMKCVSLLLKLKGNEPALPLPNEPIPDLESTTSEEMPPPSSPPGTPPEPLSAAPAGLDSPDPGPAAQPDAGSHVPRRLPVSDLTPAPSEFEPKSGDLAPSRRL